MRSHTLANWLLQHEDVDVAFEHVNIYHDAEPVFITSYGGDEPWVAIVPGPEWTHGSSEEEDNE